MNEASEPTLAALDWNRYAVFFAIAILGCSVDLATKHWVFTRVGMPGDSDKPLRVFGDVLCLETSLNEGALFGIGQGQRWVFITLSSVAAISILFWLFYARAAHDWWLTISLGLITGGIGGNLWDRLGLPRLNWHFGPRSGQPVYAVRDWIHFRIDGILDFPVFNIADSLLVMGVSVLLWQTFHAVDRPEPDTATPA